MADQALTRISGGANGAFDAVGAFALPAASKDAAIFANLSAGGYTAHITSAAATGVALAEAYDAETAAGGARLINVSARTQVGIGDDVLITGFVIGGTGLKTVLIRAVGPTLNTAFGVGGVLANPELLLYSGSTQLAGNDDWGGDPGLSGAFSTTGAFAFPASSRDAALLATLSPGGYTVHVRGVGGTTGVALAEVYEMP